MTAPPDNGRPSSTHDSPTRPSSDDNAADWRPIERIDKIPCDVPGCTEAFLQQHQLRYARSDPSHRKVYWHNVGRIRSTTTNLSNADIHLVPSVRLVSRLRETGIATKTPSTKGRSNFYALFPRASVPFPGKASRETGKTTVSVTSKTNIRMWTRISFKAFRPETLNITPRVDHDFSNITLYIPHSLIHSKLGIWLVTSLGSSKRVLIQLCPFSLPDNRQVGHTPKASLSPFALHTVSRWRASQQARTTECRSAGGSSHPVDERASRHAPRPTCSKLRMDV